MRPSKGLIRPFKGLIRVFKGLIRLFKGLIRPLKSLIRPLDGLFLFPFPCWAVQAFTQVVLIRAHQQVPIGLLFCW